MAGLINSRPAGEEKSGKRWLTQLVKLLVESGERERGATPEVNFRVRDATELIAVFDRRRR
jgi:hypothetical protein